MVGALGRDIQSSKQGIAGKVFPGVVVDNNDPQRLQRCKVRVRDLHRGLDDASIPWARKRDAARGTAPGVTNVDVPPLGAMVNVSFNDESLYSPEYFGGVFAGAAQQAPAEGYPHVVIETDQAGNTIRRDTRPGQNAMVISHASGTTITIDNAGDVRLVAAGKLEMSAQGDIDIRSGGNIYLQAPGSVHIRSATLFAKTPTSPGAAQPPWPITPVPRPIIPFVANDLEY